MNDITNDSPTDPRPLGYWLRAVDRLISIEFARALAAEGVDRRDWMLLNAVSGTVQAPWIAERLARRSGRVRRLADRGWITESDGMWTLTEAGTETFERLSSVVEGVRRRVSEAVSPEDFATTRASLEAIAEALGGTDRAGDDDERHGRFERGFGRFGRDFGPGFGHGFGHDEGRHGFGGHGFGGHGRKGFGAGDAHCRGHHEGNHGRRGGHHTGFDAYERGFTAGFERGRDAASTPAS